MQAYWALVPYVVLCVAVVTGLLAYLYIKDDEKGEFVKAGYKDLGSEAMRSALQVAGIEQPTAVQIRRARKMLVTKSNTLYVHKPIKAE